MYGWLKNEAQLLNWLRSNIRRVWNTHPSKLTLLQESRFLKATSTGRRIWHCKCSKCKKDFKMTEVEVNHKKTVGKLTADNLGDFMTNMLIVKTDDLEIVCKECHGVITYSERYDMTVEEAIIEKQVVAFTKKPADFQKKKLKQLGFEPGKTVGIRRAQAREFLKMKEKESENTKQNSK